MHALNKFNIPSLKKTLFFLSWGEVMVPIHTPVRIKAFKNPRIIWLHRVDLKGIF